MHISKYLNQMQNHVYMYTRNCRRLSLSRFNHFDMNIVEVHLVLSYLAVQFIFDIDLCNFDIDRDIDVFPLKMKLLFIIIYGV